MDITVTFPEDDSKPKAEEEVNSKIFSELLIADESDEPIFETSEVEPGTTDTTETEPEPAETTAHTTARTEPEEPTEPDPGISVN